MFGAPAHPFWPRTWTTAWAWFFIGDTCLGASDNLFRLNYWALMATIVIFSGHGKTLCHRFRLQMTYFKHWQRSPLQQSGLLIGLLSLIILSSLVFTPPTTSPISPNSLFEAFLVVSLWPFTEELFFRGWLQPIVSSHLTPIWSILLTATLFTLCHNTYWNQASLFVPILLLGLATGFLRQRYFSLWPGLILHISYNIISLIS